MFTPEDLAWPFSIWCKYNRDTIFRGRSVRQRADRYTAPRIGFEGEGPGILLDQLPMWKGLLGELKPGPADFGGRIASTETGYVEMALELRRQGDLA
jgi:hypothetical protein